MHLRLCASVSDHMAMREASCAKAAEYAPCKMLDQHDHLRLDRSGRERKLDAATTSKKRSRTDSLRPRRGFEDRCRIHDPPSTPHRVTSRLLRDYLSSFFEHIKNCSGYKSKRLRAPSSASSSTDPPEIEQKPICFRLADAKSAAASFTIPSILRINGVELSETC